MAADDSPVPAVEKLSPRGTLGTAADLLAVATPIAGVVAFFSEDDWPRTILALTLAGLALTFIAMSFRLQKLVVRSEEAHRRQVQDVKAMPSLARAIAHVARATVVADASPAQFVLHLDNACQELALMFSVASGTTCRVTVMSVYAPEEQRRRGGRMASTTDHDLATRVLCASYAERPTRSSVDWIVDNSDFDTIFAEGEPHFFSNDLPNEVANGYKNSHWDRAAIKRFTEKDSWPYKATIVWPIAYKPTGSDGKIDLVGFVSVDATELDTFEQNFDVPTGATFAHAMYSGMATYQAAQISAPIKPESDTQT